MWILAKFVAGSICLASSTSIFCDLSPLVCVSTAKLAIFHQKQARYRATMREITLMILIALGANLPSRYGLPEQTLERACAELSLRGISIVDFSNIFVTEPVPVSDQPLYSNAVAHVETELSPVAILKLLKQVEREFGRDHGGERNAARVLDLDLLVYGDEVFDMDGLSLPHPRMHERGFVLYPLSELVPKSWKHPVLKLNVEQMIAHLSENQGLDIKVQEVA